MIVSAALLLVLGAGDIHVAAATFKAVSVDEKKADFLTDYFADQVGKAGHFSVTTPAQVAAIIGQERQKQLSGCSDSSASCLAEIAGALGSDAIITGSVARIGVTYAVEVKVTRTKDAATVASASETLDREEKILPWLHDRAEEMAPKIVRALGGKVEANPHPLRSKAFVPYMIGGLLMGGAGIAHSLAESEHDNLVSDSSPYKTQADAKSAQQRGEMYNALTVGAAVAGGVAVAVGTAFVLWPADNDDISGSVGVGPGGASVSIGGRF